jgi:single-stranded-DNA-specific exonuclease
MHRRWVIQRANKDYIEHLSRAAGVSPALAQVLINRGIKEPADVSAFLDSDISSLQSPFALTGMKEAVRVIERAKSGGVRVFVHGDYDVDGVASTAIMTDALRRYGLLVDYFIPNRFRHGYGFHQDCVRKALETSAGLIITTDCGITGFESAQEARKHGIEIVITDHHEPSRNEDGNPLLPEAACIINPKLHPGEPELSSTGIAFKLAQALLGDDALEYLDLAALGTIADLVPLMEENRIIAREGLARIEKSGRPALNALKEVSILGGREVSARLLCYTLIPRLNAPGRLDDATDAVGFLLSASREDAIRGAQRLDGINRERQRIEEMIYLEARERLFKETPGPGTLEMDGAIVVAGEGWHKGVLGIVASKFTEEFYRPSVILCTEGAVARGSARSIPEFDLFQALTDSRELLLGFGGHKQAAGLRLRTEMIGAFREALSRLVRERVDEFRATLRLDADVALREISFGLVRELGRLEPFGFGNPEPLLGAKGLEVLSPRVVGSGHVKLRLRHKRTNCTIDAIGFDMARVMKGIEENFIVDAAFVPQINEWEGTRALQLNLKGIRPAG